MIENILLAVLSCGNLFLLIKFLIERHDRNKGVDERLDKLEKDGLRTQMLLLILMQPEEQTEILKIAEYYFKTLQGDWYMTSIFNKWLVTNKIAKPEWFKEV